LWNNRAKTGKAYKGLNLLHKAFGVAAVTQSIIDQAINSKWHDFEDAIHYEAAIASGCDAIVSRNTNDFSCSTLPVLSPAKFLTRLHSDEEE